MCLRIFFTYQTIIMIRTVILLESLEYLPTRISPGLALLNLPSILVNPPTHISHAIKYELYTPCRCIHRPDGDDGRCVHVTRPLRMRTASLKAKRAEHSRCIHDELTEMRFFRVPLTICDLLCLVISLGVLYNFRNILKRVRKNG